MNTTERLLEIRASIQTAQWSIGQNLPGSVSLSYATASLTDAMEAIADLIEDIERDVPGTVTSATLVPSTWVGDDPDMLDRAFVVLGPDGVV